MFNFYTFPDPYYGPNNTAKLRQVFASVFTAVKRSRLQLRKWLPGHFPAFNFQDRCRDGTLNLKSILKGDAKQIFLESFFCRTLH